LIAHAVIDDALARSAKPSRPSDAAMHLRLGAEQCDYPTVTTRTSRDLTVEHAGLTLAGTLWLPSSPPIATVLMHPGSGPSDRNNDVFFPPIRTHLLWMGIAVCSFDKRGTGGSSGRWTDAGIVEQADDALACLHATLTELDVPIGLFGHSQGGWVVVEAGSRSPDVAFVVPSSGPGVTPASQERYAAKTKLERGGASASEIDAAMRRFDLLAQLARDGVPFEEARQMAEEWEGDLDSPFVPTDEDVWKLISSALDYDPRPALERLTMPVLALFGGDDVVVPVTDSVDVYRAAVRADLLHIEVFSGADHRLQVGNPPRLADGYLETLASFIGWAVARTASRHPSRGPTRGAV
jgi:uncharacterized protein